MHDRRISGSARRTIIAVCTALLASLPAVGAVTYEPWPSDVAVTSIDKAKAFSENLSGLFYQPPAGQQTGVLWAVQNSPSKLYSLTWNGSVFDKSAHNNWGGGKTLRYPNGSGAPDAEGITKAEPDSPAIYVSAERDGSGGNRFSILRYDTSTSGTVLTATNEWNLTHDLPSAGNNLGLEAIAWIPDSYLQGNGFIDQNTGLAYDPANYPAHGSGLFFVGLEANGQIYAYALNQSGSSYVRVAAFDSGHKQIMDLAFDREKGVLWAYCDSNCKNRSHVLTIDTAAGSPMRGKFVLRKAYERPKSMPNTNNEGIAFASEGECANNVKRFFWTDDSDKRRHSLRMGAIPCGPLF